GVTMLTGTFKECEAYSVCGRMEESFDSTLVVASAGNTARAFSRVCSDNNIPLVVVVPEANLNALWSIGPVGDTVRVIAAGGDSDYSDAIALADVITSLPGFVPEGGAKNVARRDGMGTTVLSAVDMIGAIPDHYFQAVGSGTGAIAAWEANLRLIESGAYGDKKMRLHVSQNAPFQPIHDSWTARSRSLVTIDDDAARVQIASIQAKVLANRKPPYSLIGGLFDALTDTDGTTAALSNEEAQAAARLFLETEGIDIAPAASVAVADLVQSVKQSTIGLADTVMLNITGGGFLGLNTSQDVRPIPATRVIGRGNFNAKHIGSVMAEIF
ncbi:MAG: cysteate synthase, partial [Spirochaetales bacterium]